MSSLGFTVVTSRYANRDLAQRSDLAKIGITRGAPKFPTGYPFVMERLLAPSRELFSVNERERFEPKFHSQLDAVGVEQILAQLTQLSEDAGGKDLALLCYEDVRKPGEWCHRLCVASWLESRCGLVVEEYPEGDTPRRRASQSRQQRSERAIHSSPVGAVTTASATSQARPAVEPEVEQGALW